MTWYVVDENLSPRMAEALAALDLPVSHLRSLGHHGVADEEWIAALAERHSRVGIFSSDVRLTRRRAEIEARRNAGAMLFLLRNGYTALEQTRIILNRWTEIAEIATNPGKFRVFQLRPRGAVRPRRRIW